MADHGKIIERCRKVETQKSDLRQQWRESLECYNGNQWGVVYGSAVYEHERADPAQTRAVFNIYQAYANAAASMLTSGVIRPEAVALNDSPEEWAKANAATALIMYIWNNSLFKIREAAESAALDAVLMGNGFIFVSWDPLLPGPVFRDPVTGQELRFGFPRVEAVSPFRVGWDMTRPLDEARWAYIVSVVSPTDLVERFPDAKGLEPDASIGESPFAERLPGGRETTEKIGVMVFEYFERPNEDAPNGIRAILTRDKMLYSEPWPGVRMPVQHIRLYLRSESPWGRTPFYDAIRVQRALNRLMSDVLDNTSRMNAPSVLAPKGTMPQPLSFKPGARNEFDAKPGAPMPLIQHVPPLPQWAMTLVDQLIREFERVTGVHSVVFGMAPFSRVSGRTFSMMLEQVSRQYVMPATRLSQGLIDVAWSVKELWARYGPRELSVKIAPDEPETIINMDSVEAGSFRFHLEPTELMAISKQSRINELKELLQLGVLTKERFLEMAADYGMHYASADAGYQDRLWIRRQIAKMLAGQQPSPPLDVVDPKVAVRELANFIKRADFEGLPEYIKQVVVNYYQMFVTIEQQYQAQQQQPAQQGQMSSGTAGMGPTPTMENLPPELSARMGVNPTPGGPGVDFGEEMALQSIRGVM